jgi:FtsZ-binding cell division protein ZapB
MKKKTLEQMTLTGSEEEILTRLQQRVEKAIGIIQDLRRERDELKAKLEDSERFQKERDEIRNRIESILSDLEALDDVASS